MLITMLLATDFVLIVTAFVLGRVVRKIDEEILKKISRKM
jgi:hypothetical protein